MFHRVTCIKRNDTFHIKICVNCIREISKEKRVFYSTLVFTHCLLNQSTLVVLHTTLAWKMCSPQTCFSTKKKHKNKNEVIFCLQTSAIGLINQSESVFLIYTYTGIWQVLGGGRKALFYPTTQSFKNKNIKTASMQPTFKIFKTLFLSIHNQKKPCFEL